MDALHVTEAARVQYPAGTAVVQFHSMPLNTQKELYYFRFKNGDTRTAYLDEKDGLCKEAIPLLTVTGREMGCGEMALRLMPLYAAETLDMHALQALEGEGIYPLYCDGNVIHITDPAMTAEAVAEGFSIQ